VVLEKEQQQDLEKCVSVYEENLGKITAKHDKLIHLSEKILGSDNAIKIEISNEIKLNAANRAIKNEWPFFKNKNSIGDAILYESIICYKETNKDATLYFVTDNFRDFSNPDNRLEPHSEIKDTFARLNIEYKINLPELIETLTESHLSEDVKKSYHDYMGFVLLLGQKPPFQCPECKRTLIYSGYNVRNGVAGARWTCGKCGTEYLDMDESY
jgi:predicted RNA-binding Zn-ribbon protein involved in translation (DUF1610 family)